MNQPRHRRIVLIDTRFQLRMAGAFILLQVLLTGLFAFGLYLFMASELQTGLASAHAAYRSLGQMLLPLVAVLAGFSLVLSIVLVTGFVVILSHRIAGPLHRFRLVMEEVAQRRIPDHARIRPDDQLGPLSESTGQALGTLHTDLATLRSALDRAQAAQTSGDAAATANALDDLETTLGAWIPPAP